MTPEDQARLTEIETQCRDDIEEWGSISKQVIPTATLLALLTEHKAALALLGYAEDETDLLENIKRLKAYYEQELRYAREGTWKLTEHALKLQGALEAITEVDWRKHDYDYGRTYAETQDIALKALSTPTPLTAPETMNKKP